MLRIMLFISLLLHTSEANPRFSWAKAEQDRIQEVVMSENFNGKLPLGMKEVEPPEELALTDDDIDPSMVIWSMVKTHPEAEENRDNIRLTAPLKVEEPLNVRVYSSPEEDRDETYHPSLENLAEVARLTAPLKPEEKPNVRVYTHPEEDRDEIYHPSLENLAKDVRLTAQLDLKGHLNVRIFPHPEEDRDHVYHRNVPIVHTELEDDMDNMHHSDTPEWNYLPQVQTKQEKEPMFVDYSRPEEDRDHLYHH